MTPTLFGRWQSRHFLSATFGLIVSSLFPLFTNSSAPFMILAVVFTLGLGWDLVYNELQKLRWDHDWPPVLQVAAAIFEGVFIFVLLYGFNLIARLPPIGLFLFNYTAVWLTTFPTHCGKISYSRKTAVSRRCWQCYDDGGCRIVTVWGG